MNRSDKIGYCTNVHAGVTIDQVKQNLAKIAIPVKNAFSPGQEMGIGLWLTDQAAMELLDRGEVSGFRDWLNDSGLCPFTFNAFPFSDFHQSVVKHKVYEPSWAETSRLNYTLNIAKIQSALLPVGSFGSVSTLPLGWGTNRSDDFIQACVRNLIRCCEQLAELKDRTGRHIIVCLEPEPGCILDLSKHVVELFDRLKTGVSISCQQRIHEHLGVCHDVCHAAVMGESQPAALKNYQDNEIQIGKYQISSAICADFNGKSDTRKQQMIDTLESFAEDRYLHQTVICESNEFFEDLPLALEKYHGQPEGKWKIHFHVPLFIESFGGLETSQSDISQMLGVIDSSGSLPLHFEVETYAWTVLPSEMQEDSLAAGIAKELDYFRRCLDRSNSVEIQGDE